MLLSRDDRRESFAFTFGLNSQLAPKPDHLIRYLSGMRTKLRSQFLSDDGIVDTFGLVSAMSGATLRLPASLAQHEPLLPRVDHYQGLRFYPWICLSARLLTSQRQRLIDRNARHQLKMWILGEIYGVCEGMLKGPLSCVLRSCRLRSFRETIR